MNSEERENLPAVVEMNRGAAYYPAQHYQNQNQSEEEPEEAKIPLSQYLWIL